MWEDPLAELPRPSDNEDWEASLGGVSPSGQTLVARVCERGVCQSLSTNQPPGEKGVWASVDGGETWERWGDFPEGVRVGWVSVVTEDDVAVFSPSDATDAYRAWWFRSGEELEPPEDIASPRILGWLTDGDAPQPIWEDGDGTVAVSASGDVLPRPPGFSLPIPLPDGSLLWSKVTFRSVWHEEPGGRDLFLHLSDQGGIVGAYSWDGPSSLVLIGHVEGQLFAGFLGTWGCKDVMDTVLEWIWGCALSIHSPGSRGAPLFPSRPGQHPTSLLRSLRSPSEPAGRQPCRAEHGVGRSR